MNLISVKYLVLVVNVKCESVMIFCFFFEIPSFSNETKSFSLEMIKLGSECRSQQIDRPLIPQHLSIPATGMTFELNRSTINGLK